MICETAMSRDMTYVYELDLVKSQIGHSHIVNIRGPNISVIFSWWQVRDLTWFDEILSFLMIGALLMLLYENELGIKEKHC